MTTYAIEATPTALVPTTGPSDTVTVNALADRFKTGDPSAYDALYTRLGPKIEAHIASMVADHERAKELAQDVWLNVLTKWAETKEDSHFAAWVYQAATNRALDHLRRGTSAAADGGRVKWEPIPDFWMGGAGDAYGHTVPKQLVSTETPETLALDAVVGGAGGEAALLMEMLSRPDRRILWLREWRGWPYEQIAVALKTTIPGVKSRLYRAREAQRVVWERNHATRRGQVPLEERVWRNLVGGRAWALAHQDACWPWVGFRSTLGYPGIGAVTSGALLGGTGRVPRQQLVAVRVLYALLRGVLPPWANLARCGRGEYCVNPFHAPVVCKMGPRVPAALRYQEASPAGDRPAAAVSSAGNDRRAVAEAPFWPSGASLKQRRLALGLPRTVVAKEAGMEPTTLFRAERGDLLLPSLMASLRAALLRLEARYPRMTVDTPERLRALRTAAGLSAHQLSVLAGVSYSSLRLYERHEQRTLTDRVRRRLQDAFDRLERERQEQAA